MTTSYRLSETLELPGIHPDAVREALGVFEFHGGSTGPEPEAAMARAIATYLAWEGRQAAADRERYLRGDRFAGLRRDREQFDLAEARGRTRARLGMLSRVVVSSSQR